MLGRGGGGEHHLPGLAERQSGAATTVDHVGAATVVFGEKCDSMCLQKFHGLCLLRICGEIERIRD